MLLLFLPLEVHFTFESYIYKSGNHITPSNGVIMAVIPVTCCSLKGTLSWKKMQLFTCGSFYFLYHKKSLFVLLLIDNDPTVLFDHCTSDKGPGHYRQQIHSTVRIRCLIYPNVWKDSFFIAHTNFSALILLGLSTAMRLLVPNMTDNPRIRKWSYVCEHYMTSADNPWLVDLREKKDQSSEMGFPKC